MNLNRVYVKTSAGEEAVHQRTRLVQRNLRNVLIFVDGKSSAADLASKVGSDSLVVEALEQLERDGFITLAGVREDGGGAALGEFEHVEPFIADNSFGVEVPVSPIKMNVANSSLNVNKSPFSSPTNPHSGLSPFGAASQNINLGPLSIPPPLASVPQGKGGQSIAQNPFAIASQPVESVAVPILDSLSKSSIEHKAAVKKEGLSGSPSKDVHRKRGDSASTSKKLVLTLVSVLVFLVLGVLLFPYDKYRSEIETELSSSLGQTVKVGRLGIHVFPAPALVLHAVALGDEGLFVGDVVATPRISSLFSKQKVFSSVSLVGARLPVEYLGRLVASLDYLAQRQDFLVERIEFSHLTVALRDIVFADYSGFAELQPAGHLKQLSFNSPDGLISLLLEPAGVSANVSIEATNWKALAGSSYVFDSLNIKGVLSDTNFAAQKIEGRVFGGLVQGVFGLDWSSGIAVNGDVSADFITSDLLAKALGLGSLVIDGQVNARVRFKAQGVSWDNLSGKIPLDGTLQARNGAVHGIDVVEAVRRTSQLPMRGGTTRFEQLNSRFRWDTGAFQLRDIDMNSGLVRATGAITVASGGRLSGGLDVQLKGSAMTSRTPVEFAGTLVDPQLFSSRR